MTDGPEHIELELTPEQQALVRRLSGKQAHVLELTLNPTGGADGTGRALQFRWRLSEASGIPRQRWDKEGDPSSAS